MKYIISKYIFKFLWTFYPSLLPPVWKGINTAVRTNQIKGKNLLGALAELKLSWQNQNMLFLLLPIFIQFTSVLYTLVPSIWVPFDMYAVIIQSLYILCNNNFLTFTNIQYRDGH